jgi:hypothetical protein
MTATSRVPAIDGIQLNETLVLVPAASDTDVFTTGVLFTRRAIWLLDASIRPRFRIVAFTDTDSPRVGDDVLIETASIERSG